MEDVFEMHLNDEYYNLIAEDKKIYEIRINDIKRQQIQVGNFITFINRADDSQRIKCVVDQLLYFDTFVDLFSNIKKEDCGFSEKLTADQIEDVFLKFYSAKEMATNGLVVIKVSKI